MIGPGQPVTVIGAGVAGLAIALVLARHGMTVTVLEQATAVTDIGAGLQISPNGVAVLAALGLGRGLASTSLSARAVSLRDGITDAPVLMMDLARYAARGFHLIHRADLISLLRDAAVAEGVDIRLNTKIARVDIYGNIPQLTLDDDTRHNAPLLIGADGLHSAVRTALNGPEVPFFTHQVAWRATIPNTGMPDPLVEVHMGPGRHLVSYPLRGGRLRNIVAVEERRSWADESWSSRDDPHNLQRAFSRFSPKVKGWLDRVDAPFLWGLFRHPVAKTWFAVLPQGAVAILGDAAHPTLPFLAQGANMALEDAWVLGSCLANAKDPAAALAKYQTLREARCKRLVAAANSNAKAYHLSGLPRTIAHLGLRVGGRVAPSFALRRFGWIYQTDVTSSPVSPQI